VQRAASTEEQQLREVVRNEIIDTSPGVSWDSIAGDCHKLDISKLEIVGAAAWYPLEPDIPDVVGQ